MFHTSLKPVKEQEKSGKRKIHVLCTNHVTLGPSRSAVVHDMKISFFTNHWAVNKKSMFRRLPFIRTYRWDRPKKMQHISAAELEAVTGKTDSALQG